MERMVLQSFDLMVSMCCYAQQISREMDQCTHLIGDMIYDVLVCHYISTISVAFSDDRSLTTVQPGKWDSCAPSNPHERAKPAGQSESACPVGCVQAHRTIRLAKSFSEFALVLTPRATLLGTECHPRFLSAAFTL